MLFMSEGVMVRGKMQQLLFGQPNTLLVAAETYWLVVIASKSFCPLFAAAVPLTI